MRLIVNSSKGNKSILWIILLCALPIAAALIYLILTQFTNDKAPNIILISIDTLRHDHVGFAGHKPEGRSTTPYIDSLSEKSAVFLHGVSSSTWTLPGHYSLLTGLPNSLHRMVDDRISFKDKLETMAENLKTKNYKTGGFYSGPYLHPHFGFDQGFDNYEECMDEPTIYETVANKKLTREQVQKLNIVKERRSHEEVTSRNVTDNAINWVRRNKDDKIFLFLHYFDPHYDYHAPAPFNNLYYSDYNGPVNGQYVVHQNYDNPEDLKKTIALYDGEISWVDHNIDRLFKALNKIDRSIIENSIVVITSDHGEEFFEHKLIGHRKNLYAASLRIP